MNPFKLLWLPFPEVKKILAQEYDTIFICYSYIPKMLLLDEQPKNPRSKVYFNEVHKSLRVNPNLALQELDPRT